MVVRIRLQRMGRRHQPFYRIGVCDARKPRDGRMIENVGYYDPLAKAEEKQVVLKEDRIRYWLSQGAQPSKTVADILKRRGIALKK